jgi:hypothetical protein
MVGLTQLTNRKNADAGLTFSSVFQHSGIYLQQPRYHGFPHHFSVQQGAHPWGALPSLHLVELRLLHLAELCCNPAELPCTLLSYPPHTLHPAELCYTLLNYAAPSEQGRSLLSHRALY